jgi:hypothetical protein
VDVALQHPFVAPAPGLLHDEGMDPCGNQPGSEGTAEVVAISLVLGTFAAAPAADEKKLTPQQEKMKPCYTQAADKKGDEPKAFMSECLKAGAPAAPMTQQDKMKACNTKAGEKKSDERKTFMSECLKADKKS